MNEFLVQLIVVAVLANVVLLLAALIVPRLRRPSRPLAAASPGTLGDNVAFAVPPAPVMVSAIPAETAAPVPSALPTEAEGDSTSDMRSDTEDTQRQRRFYVPREEDYPTPESVEAFLTAGQRREDSQGPILDEETGLATGLGWELAVEREEKRVARYGNAVTVVVAELDRLDALAARLGQENADRLVPPVATTLHRFARAADLVARTAHARFQVLMPQTDEVQAINYVERIREACDMWLDASAVSVRLVVGWASVGSGVSIRDATRLAEQRMHADRARPSYGHPARRDAVAASRSEPFSAPSGTSAPGPTQAPAAPIAPASEATTPAPGAAGPAQPEPFRRGDAFRPGPATGPTV